MISRPQKRSARAHARTHAGGRNPGLIGSLEPECDTHGRTYVYAPNISINDGQPQPAHFLLGEPLRLIDANGSSRIVRIVDTVGRAALVEYSTVA